MSRRVVHVITGLPTGGAQMMLYKLVSRTDRTETEPEVVSLLEPGALGGPIRDLGVRLRSLGLRPGPGVLAGTLRLAGWLRAERPDVVQCWMYHADLVGGLAARLAGLRSVLWGLRQSAPDPRGTKRATLWVVAACARLSRVVPARIVCCSEASRRDHAALGYDEERMVVIPNGFDLDSFRPDDAARAEFRRELGVPGDAPLVGLVARFHPQKDHATFLAAARVIAERVPETRFVLCGEGVDAENLRVDESALRGRVLLLGERSDVARITAALDVACSSSAFAEGFPNAVGEAMSCGVPCVVTDVGDSAELVGETGRVVPPGRPQAFAEAVSSLLTAPAPERRRLGEAARRRVADRYELRSIVSRYERLHREVADS